VNHIVGFWIVRPSGDQFPYFSSWAEGLICIFKPMFRIGLRFGCPKESPLTWVVTFQCPRNKKGAFKH